MSETIVDNSLDWLFKPWYVFKVEVYDFDSPEIKAQIAQALREGREIIERWGWVLEHWAKTQ